MSIRRREFIGGAGAAIAGAAFPQIAAARGSRDLVVTAGTIHTVDPHNTKVQAFVVRDGRFAYVGSVPAAKAFAKRGAEWLQLRGQTILPGLIDAHIHLQSVGLDLNEVPLHHVASFDEVIARTVSFAKTSPDAWILGSGWDQNLWPGKAFPTHDRLSAAIPDRAVVLERVDGHAILANARAMQLAHVTKDTPEPQGGRILRDAAGNPTGVFIDNARGLIYAAVPTATHDQLTRATRLAMQEAHRYGLTGVADPGSGPDNIAVYEELARRGELDLRTYIMLADNAQLINDYTSRGPLSAAYGGRLWIRAIKLYADGALGSRGAALLAPYSDDPGNTGLLRVTQAHIQEVAQLALRRGFQVCVHAIGDRGNRMVLDAYQQALQIVPKTGHRFRVEHAQVISPEDIARFARLGVTPSMQTTHQISDMAWAQARLGPERIMGAYAWRSLLDTGVIIPGGTDAPVEEVSTLRTFHAAVTRQNERNEPAGGWYPAQRMTRDEALRSMTIWAAHANFQERLTGSIETGKYADFVVMDRDWMTMPAAEIVSTRIMGTYFQGRAVYQNDGGSAARVWVRGLRSVLQPPCACHGAQGRTVLTG